MHTRSTCAVVFALFFALQTGHAQTYDFEPKARSGGNYLSAAFRCWIPETDKPLAGVLVIVPGQNADGRDAVSDSAYQSKCQEWNFALVGCYFTGDATRFYSQARGGSGRALEDAMRDFSDQSGKRELANAPMALLGFSTGGQFAFGMTCYKSEDVIAFVCDKGAFYTSRPDGGTYDTPGLFIVGEKDQRTKSAANTLKVFSNGKGRRAIWALHTEQGQDHEPAGDGVKNVMLDFIDAAIELRTDPERPLNDPDKVRYDAGVYLNRTSGEITERNNRIAEDSADWSWLPTRELADQILASEDLKPDQE